MTATRTSPAPYASGECGSNGLQVRRRVEEPLRRTQHERLGPRTTGELDPDRDPVRVESGTNGAGRQAAKILRSRERHHEVAERDLLAAVQSRLRGIRERLPRTDGSQEHVALVEQAGESRTNALPVG